MLDGQLKLEAKPTEMSLCPVCYTNEIQPSYKSVDKDCVELDCKHRFCRECVKLHLKNKISDRALDMNCMQSGCSQLYTELNLQAIFVDEPENLKKRRKFTNKRLDEMNPLLRWC